MKRFITNTACLALLATLLLTGGQSVTAGPALQTLTGPGWKGLNGQMTALDVRRRDTLQKILTRDSLNGEDGSLPTPNYKFKAGAANEGRYLNRAGALFGLVDMGVLSQSRLEEANRVLRYCTNKWPITQPSQLAGDAGAKWGWRHTRRGKAMRLYFLYRQWMDADIRTEYERRIGFMVRDPFNGASENIRWTNNSAYFLSHELEGRTGTTTFSNVRNWVIRWLKQEGNNGFLEWGSGYSMITLEAIATLAEFAQDAEVKRRAQMIVDHTFARFLVQSVGNGFCSTGVRRYMWNCLNGAVEEQSDMIQVLTGTTNNPDISITWALSNYRPLQAHQTFFNAGPMEVRYKDINSLDNTQLPWWGRNFTSQDFSMSVFQAVQQRCQFRQHDDVLVNIQSRKGPQFDVVPFGHRPETPPDAKRNVTERSFSHKNVAIYQHGGTTLWFGSSQRTQNVPIRLFVYKGFSREIQNGWLFLNDGMTYVAWAPTVGNPELDPEDDLFQYSTDGFYYRSSYQGDDWGEMAVIEVGDASMYGNYASFKNEILSRNSRPRLSGGKITYQHRDGTNLELSNTAAKINGATWTPGTNWPRVEAPGLTGTKITAGGANITYNWDAGTISGSQPRLTSNMSFGNAAPLPTVYPLAGFVYDPVNSPQISGWAYDHESTVTRIEVVVDSSPVHASPKVLGTIDCTGNVSVSTETNIRSYIQANVGVSPPAGTTFGWGENFETFLLNHPDTTQSGAYNLTFRLIDQQASSNVKFLDVSGTAQSVFPIQINLNDNDPPLAPKDLYVDNVSAQQGSTGNPVVDIDLDPVFSAIFDDPDLGDTAPEIWIQVSTDPTFATVSHWDSGVTALSTPTSRGNRSADIPYGGSALSYSTRYYWRMIFIDDDGELGAVHGDQLSFTTEDAPVINTTPAAPSDLFVGSDTADTGLAGDPSNPVVGIDLTPVFSAEYNDADAGDTSELIRLQVASDETFQTGTVWLVPGVGQTIASVTAGSRCEDIPYGGDPLQTGTTYYWRMIFRDAAGAWSAVSPTGSFTTEGTPPTGASGGSSGGGGGGCATGGSSNAMIPWLLLFLAIITLRFTRREV